MLALTLPPPPPTVPSPPAIVSSAGAVVPWDAYVEALRGARVVMAGERHDEAEDHRMQAEVVAQMPAGTTVGLEMLDHTQQPALDEFLAGRMSEADFAAFWKKAWGFDYALYKPIFDEARRRGLPMRALNAPRSVITQIARGGVASLTPQQRALLPPALNPITHPKYLAYVKKALSEHGPMDPAREARMIEAQAVWNETMAHHALVDGPIVIVVGQGHVVYGAGIGESLRARGTSSIVTVLPGPPSELDQADYFRVP